jgi:hypothetical protein
MAKASSNLMTSSTTKIVNRASSRLKMKTTGKLMSYFMFPRRPKGAIRVCWEFLLPFLPLGILLYSVQPGYLSLDSAFQFWQARHNEYFDVTPPLFPWIWHLMLPIFPDTTGILLLIFLSYSLGIGFSAFALRNNQCPQRMIYVFAAAAPMCPVALLLLGHMWTDVLLGGVLLLAFALISIEDRKSFWRILAILFLLIFASGLRHNSLIALIPLFWFWTRPQIASAMPRRAWYKRAAWVFALTATCWVAAQLMRTALVERRLDTWAVTLLFDLQAVSVNQNINRIPQSLLGTGMQTDELVAAFNPYSATALFSGTRSGVVNPVIGALTPRQREDLIAAWRSLLLEPSYWQHRFRLFRGLMGAHTGPEFAGLVDAPQLFSYDDNPPLSFTHERAHRHYRALVDGLKSTPIYATGLYLLVAGLAIMLRWRASPIWLRERYMALYGSALIYAAPYFFIAPSAELRYVLWSAFAAWLCILLCLLHTIFLATGGRRQQ